MKREMEGGEGREDLILYFCPVIISFLSLEFGNMLASGGPLAGFLFLLSIPFFFSVYLSFLCLKHSSFLHFYIYTFHSLLHSFPSLSTFHLSFTPSLLYIPSISPSLLPFSIYLLSISPSLLPFSI